MNKNKKLVAMLIGTLALTNTVMPVCAEPAELNMELAEDFEILQNDTENVKKPGNLNLLDASVGLVSSSNNMNTGAPIVSPVGLASNISNMNNNKVAYQIQTGDTLSSIAKANKTTVAELIKNTGIKDPNKIKAGDIIISPHIKEDFVLSKGQDSEQMKKNYIASELKKQTISQVHKRTITDSEKEILRSLFNAEEYAKMYPDVAEACKNSVYIFSFEERLFYHFITFGIWESRQPSASFSVSAYASAYSDLKESFGGDIVDYYTHYYNTTVTGNENRTITTVQKAQDAGIKVTDFDGNTVAVDASGNIVKGAEADKIAAEKNLAVQTGPIKTPIPKIELPFEVDKETEKKEPTKEDIDTNVSPEPEKTEVEKPSEEKPEEEKPEEEPVTPTPSKTYKEAYLEWLAEKPDDGSYGDAYCMWLAKEPNLADYEDGRAFLAKKEAWKKEMPDYDAYLATTNYASDYETWKSEEPILADYEKLIENGTYADKAAATDAYNKEHSAWLKKEPSKESYIADTTYADDMGAWEESEPDFGEYFGIEVSK